jgi:hypothetical protein
MNHVRFPSPPLPSMAPSSDAAVLAPLRDALAVAHEAALRAAREAPLSSCSTIDDILADADAQIVALQARISGAAYDAAMADWVSVAAPEGYANAVIGRVLLVLRDVRAQYAPTLRALP